MKKVVGVILFFAFLGVSMTISFGIVRYCAVLFATPNTSVWEFAYVSESPNAHKYHYSEDCKALRKTPYDIEMLSVREAEDYDYQPCNLCLEKLTRYQWDDAVGLFFIPVSCLILCLIDKIDQFRKKYKFHTPIIRR